MRLGGFVIHGSSETLGGALDSLLDACDEVVAVDSGADDATRALVAARPRVRAVHLPWQGYGAARAAAAAALSPTCDWLVFLDSDETFNAQSREWLRAFKQGAPAARVYRLPIRDWVDLPSGRFLYRTERHVRLLHRDAAAWSARMIVHEGISRAGAAFGKAVVEHTFARSVEGRAGKEDRYALLWALRAAAEGRRGKPALLQRPAHVLRDALFKGALFRGGLDALRLAWTVSRYHAQKYRYLARLRAGEFAQLQRLYAEGRYRALFEALEAL